MTQEKIRIKKAELDKEHMLLNDEWNEETRKIEDLKRPAVLEDFYVYKKFRERIKNLEDKYALLEQKCNHPVTKKMTVSGKSCILCNDCGNIDTLTQ